MRQLLFGLTIFCFHYAQAQDFRGFLYGTIQLKNNKSYTGQIRWDNNDGSWDDLFEAYKNEPQLQEQIEIKGYNQKQDNSESVFELSFMKLWENKDQKSRFAFRCHYGHIQKIIELKDNKYATLMLKNGARLRVRKRGSDIGDDIFMYHSSLGVMEFDWQNIKSIEFASAPRGLKNHFGSKIFGDALTVDGSMEGYVIWDFDEEAYDKDIIDGYHQKANHKIEFGKLQSLTPEREGALLTLKDGTRLFLRNSSDVNKDNDGIFLKTENAGMINLNWSNLIKINFTKPSYKSKSFDDFKAPKPLKGKVVTNSGKSYNGNLAYDLDEIWDIEILDGKSKGTKYYIPFYLIKSIQPQNYNYSLIKLTNGESFMLGEEGDVNHRNNGVLVWLSESKTTYVPWKDVKSITFNHK